MTVSMTPQQAKYSSGKRSAFSLYRELAVGEGGMAALAKYELLTTLFGNLAGLAGMGSRALLYPSLFKSCGKRPAIGRGVVLRCPRQATLGKGVLIDDYAVLDVRGSDSELVLSDHVFIGRFTTIAAKWGSVLLRPGANIGSYCRIATNSKIDIGESVLVGAYCYIGPGNHQQGDETLPLIEREMDIRGGVTIGAHAWIGAGATILDGVTVGERAIVGAQSLVREDVPAGAVVAGTPAKILKPKP